MNFPLYIRYLGAFGQSKEAHDVALNLKEGGREASIIIFYKLYLHNSLLRVLLHKGRSLSNDTSTRSIILLIMLDSKLVKISNTIEKR